MNFSKKNFGGILRPYPGGGGSVLTNLGRGRV